MNVIILKPANRTSYAWKSRGRWHVGTVNKEYVKNVLKRAASMGVTHCVITDCFAGKNLHQIIQKLAHDAGMTTDINEESTL